MEALNQKGAVLVGDEERLLAVVTAADVNSYLWTAARQFMIVRDVELATRYLAQRACATEDELRALVAAARPTDANGNPAERLEDLTFGELISVINSPERFGRVFSRTFGSSRELVFSMLEPVRDVRNKVFHFRDAVTPDEVDLVMNARVWLQRRVRMVQLLLAHLLTPCSPSGWIASATRATSCCGHLPRPVSRRPWRMLSRAPLRPASSWLCRRVASYSSNGPSCSGATASLRYAF
ncbi:hypothetical protein [Micromonospora sp. NPDC007230]|uniref:hypothetical protein n=1 Tax=Micromonospora sp. NPDC007230 TaxID=3364237 RepID=UPI0036A65549